MAKCTSHGYLRLYAVNRSDTYLPRSGVGRKTGSIVLVSEITDNIFFRTFLQPADFALHLLRVHGGATRPHSRTLEEIVKSDGVQHETSGICRKQVLPRIYGLTLKLRRRTTCAIELGKKAKLDQTHQSVQYTEGLMRPPICLC